MKKTLTVMTMVIALALSTMAGAFASGHAEIISPTAGEVVYEDALYLEAKSGAEVSVNVAVRKTTEADDNCSWQYDNDGIYKDISGTLFTDTNGVYSDTVDVSGAEPGLYCFAFDPADAPRISVKFYIVDDYILVDASIDEALDTYDPDTGKPDYSISGVVGLYGTDSVAGTLEVRYHEPKLTCWIDASTGTFRTGDTGFDADSINDYAGVDDADYACDNGDTGTFGSVFFLDPATTGVTGWPGGAVVLDEDADRTTVGDKDLIGDLLSSFYWVPLDRGQVEFVNIW